MSVIDENIVIGISFGTVYSCVSIPGKDGLAPEAIANEDGHRQIPSYVAFTEYEQLCGTQAKQQALANPLGTISHFRQLLGKNFDHSIVDHHQSKFRFSIIADEKNKNLPVYQTEYLADGADEPTIQKHSVVQVTAKYLAKLKDTAEYYLSKTVDGCVISIPAHFDDKQKKELVEAAKQAGFKNAYPIHEPVAAALAFNASLVAETSQTDKQILVLDLGAESFNISLISVHDGLYTIEESDEELGLGGIMFDKALLQFCMDDFKRKTKLDITGNKRAITKLLNSCEVAKRSLTRQDTAPCSVESLYEGIDYNGSILRGRFDMICESLYSRCRQAVLQTLKKAKISAGEIDQVLVIGGSSRMPQFQSTMKSIFPNIGGKTEFRVEVEPDEAIALGCAVQAGILLENNVELNLKIDKKVIDAEHLSKSIGVLSSDGAFIPIIPAGTPLPVRRHFTIALPPKQTSVHLQVCEDGVEPTLLGDVGLSGLDSGIKDGSVEVVLLIEDDHILSVCMTEQVSGEMVTAALKQ